MLIEFIYNLTGIFEAGDFSIRDMTVDEMARKMKAHLNESDKDGVEFLKGKGVR